MGDHEKEVPYTDMFYVYYSYSARRETIKVNGRRGGGEIEPICKYIFIFTVNNRK